MTRKWRFACLPVLAVGLSLLLTGLSAGQKLSDKDSKDLTREGAKKEPAKADEEVEAWVQMLVKRITDRHDTIRDSARAALVAVGKPAIPVLRKLAEGDDSATATAARKVILQIEQGGGRRPFGPPDGPRYGGPYGGASGAFGIERAINELKLDEKQKAKVGEILKAHQNKMRKIFEDTGGGRPEPEKMQATFEKLRKELLADMKKVLTKEQFAKFEEAVKKSGPFGGPPRGGPRGEGSPRGDPRGGRPDERQRE